MESQQTDNQLAIIPGVNLTLNAVTEGKLQSLEALNTMFSFLSEPDQAEEHEYRNQLASNFGRMVMLRFDQGRILSRYQRWCKFGSDSGKKISFDEVCEKHLGFDRRTAYRIIEDYRSAKLVAPFLREEALSRGMDLAEAKNREIVDLLSEEDEYAPDDPGLRKEKAKKILDHTLRLVDSQRQQSTKAKNTKSKLDQTVAFLERLYDGEDVSTVRREVPEALKKLTHYKRGDEEIVGKDRKRK